MKTVAIEVKRKHELQRAEELLHEILTWAYEMWQEDELIDWARYIGMTDKEIKDEFGIEC